MELIGPYLVACGLLVVAGSAKVVRPGDTAIAVSQFVGRPAGRLRIAVRVGAGLEVVLGVVALVTLGRLPAAVVAASYLGFAGYLAVVRQRGGAVASCGCFGEPDTPATALHVVLDLGLGASALVVALAGTSGSLSSVLAGQPWHGVPLALASVVCGWLVVLAMSTFGRLQLARRQIRTTGGPA